MSTKTRTHWIDDDQAAAVLATDFLKNPVCRCHAKLQVMGATVGMYGDLQGIAGKSLQEIEAMALAALESPYGKQQAI